MLIAYKAYEFIISAMLLVMGLLFVVLGLYINKQHGGPDLDRVALTSWLMAMVVSAVAIWTAACAVARSSKSSCPHCSKPIKVMCPALKGGIVLRKPQDES